MRSVTITYDASRFQQTQHLNENLSPPSTTHDTCTDDDDDGEHDFPETDPDDNVPMDVDATRARDADADDVCLTS